MSSPPTTQPAWGRLFEVAAQQDGLFTTRQVAESGYSPQLLSHHLRAGCMVRVRRGVPSGVVLHFPDLADDDRARAGAVQVTSARRTIIDCAATDMSPKIVEQATDEALHRGLFTAAMIELASEYLRSFEWAWSAPEEQQR